MLTWHITTITNTMTVGHKWVIEVKVVSMMSYNKHITNILVSYCSHSFRLFFHYQNHSHHSILHLILLSPIPSMQLHPVLSLLHLQTRQKTLLHYEITLALFSHLDSSSLITFPFSIQTYHTYNHTFLAILINDLFWIPIYQSLSPTSLLQAQTFFSWNHC